MGTLGTFLRTICILLTGLIEVGSGLHANAQEDAGFQVLYPTFVDGKWGLISESGEVITEPTYDNLKDFRSPVPGCSELKFDSNFLGAEGPIAASSGGLWGFVGPGGEIIPPTYSEVYGFNDGIAAVSRGSKWGYIDATGAEVIAYKYDFASRFRNGASVVMVDDRWGLIDRDGNYLVEPKYDKIRNLPGSSNYMFEANGKQGVLNASGEVLIEAQFDRLGGLSEDLLNVYVDGEGGYFNVETQNFEIEPQFDLAAPFVGSVAQVSKDGLLGFIDRNGDFTFPPLPSDKPPRANFLVYEFLFPDLNPVHRYQIQPDRQLKWGLINVTDGTVVMPPELDDIGQVSEGRAVFWDGDKAGYLDAEGNIVIPAKFDMAFDFSGGLAYVRFRDGSGYIDPKGEIKIRFDGEDMWGGPFRPDLAYVYGDGRERYIDQDGNEIYSFNSGCHAPSKSPIIEEELPPCIALNEALSICTNVEGLGVSFVDGTPTAAMGLARLQAHENVVYVWFVEWEVEVSFEDYAREAAQSLLHSSPGYSLQDRVDITLEGFSGFRYDLLPKDKGNENFPKSLLLLDAKGGFFSIFGEAREPSVRLENLHEGATSAARMLKTSAE